MSGTLWEESAKKESGIGYCVFFLSWNVSWRWFIWGSYFIIFKRRRHCSITGENVIQSTFSGVAVLPPDWWFRARLLSLFPHCSAGRRLQVTRCWNVTAWLRLVWRFPTLLKAHASQVRKFDWLHTCSSHIHNMIHIYRYTLLYWGGEPPHTVQSKETQMTAQAKCLGFLELTTIMSIKQRNGPKAAQCPKF